MEPDPRSADDHRRRQPAGEYDHGDQQLEMHSGRPHHDRENRDRADADPSSELRHRCDQLRERHDQHGDDRIEQHVNRRDRKKLRFHRGAAATRVAAQHRLRRRQSREVEYAGRDAKLVYRDQRAANRHRAKHMDVSVGSLHFCSRTERTDRHHEAFIYGYVVSHARVSLFCQMAVKLRGVGRGMPTLLATHYGVATLNQESCDGMSPLPGDFREVGRPNFFNRGLL